MGGADTAWLLLPLATSTRCAYVVYYVARVTRANSLFENGDRRETSVPSSAERRYRKHKAAHHVPREKQPPPPQYQDQCQGRAIPR